MTSKTGAASSVNGTTGSGLPKNLLGAEGLPGKVEHDDVRGNDWHQAGLYQTGRIWLWYCSFHHNAEGENVPYRYSYLFAYAIDLPTGAKTITLPNNKKIRMLAISVAEENPEVRPVQPLYDTLARGAAAVQ